MPEPSSLYEVSIEYTVPKLDATSVSVSLGFGYDKAKANSLSNIAPNVSQQVGEFKEVTNETQTATFTYNVPENTGDILPCFVVSAAFGGRKDSTNTAPVSYIAISKVTVKKVEVKGLGYGGASVLKEEVAEILHTLRARGTLQVLPPMQEERSTDWLVNAMTSSLYRGILKKQEEQVPAHLRITV